MIHTLGEEGACALVVEGPQYRQQCSLNTLNFSHLYILAQVFSTYLKLALPHLCLSKSYLHFKISSTCPESPVRSEDFFSLSEHLLPLFWDLILSYGWSRA